MKYFTSCLSGKQGSFRRFLSRRVYKQALRQQHKNHIIINRRLFRIKNKKQPIYTKTSFIQKLISLRKPVSNFERCYYVKSVTPQSEDEPEDYLEDENFLDREYDEFENEEEQTVFARFKKAFLRQFGGILPFVGNSARTIGLSAKNAIINAFHQVFDILAPLASGSFGPLFRMLKRLIGRLTQPIFAYIQSKIENFFSISAIVSNLVMIVMVTLAFVLPKSQVGMYMRFALAACGLLVGYYENIYGAVFGAVFSHVLVRFSPTTSVDVTVNLNATRVEPQAEPIDDYLERGKVKEDFKQLACQLLSCLSLCTLASAGLALPSDAKSIDDMLRRHAVLGRAYQTWDLMIDKFGDLVETSIQIVTKYLYKQEYIPKNKVREVEELYRETMILCTLRGNQQVGRDPSTALKVEALYIQMMLLRRAYRENRKVMLVLDEVAGPLLAMYKRVLEKNPHAHTMRKEPVCVVFHGKTGVGKSYLMTQLQIDLLKIVDKFDPTKTLEALVYSRCFEQEYWDGFMGQPIVIFDDFAQAVDSVTNPNIEFFELIRTINIFPYQPHCAAIGDKANNPFTADFVILTTNVKELQAKSLYSNDAVKRRIHLNYEVTLKQEVTEQYWYNKTTPLVEMQEPTNPFVSEWDKTPRKPVPPNQGHRLNARALAEYRRENNLPDTDISHYEFRADGQILSYNEMLATIAEQTRQHQLSFDQRQEISNVTKDKPLPAGVWSRGTRWIPQAEDEVQPDRYNKMSFNLFMKQSKRVRIQLLQQGMSVYQYCQDLFEPVQFSNCAEFKRWAQEVGYEMEGGGIIIPADVLRVLTLQSGDKRSFAEFAQYHFGWDKTANLEGITDELPNWRKTYLNLWKRFEHFKKSLTAKVLNTTNPEAYGQFDWRKVRFYLLLATFAATSVYTAYRALTSTGVWSSKEAYKSTFFTMFLRYIQVVGLTNFCGMLGIPFMAASLLTTGWFYGSFIKDILAHETFHDIHKLESDSCMKCLGFAQWKRNIFGTQLWKEYVKQMEQGKLEPLKPSSDEIAAAMSEVKLEYGEMEVKKDSPKLEYGEMEVKKDSPKLEYGEMEVKKDQPKLEMDNDIGKLFRLQTESGRGSEGSSKKKFELQGFFSEQTNMLVDKVRSNQWQMCIGQPDDFKVVGTIFMLKGHVGLVNYHYLERMSLYKQDEQAGHLIMFRQHNQPPSHMMKLTEFLATLSRVARGQLKTEFYSFKCPKTMPMAADMSKHLITAQELSKLTRGTRMMLATFEQTSSRYERVIREGTYVETFLAELPSLNEPGRYHHYPETLKYMMSTRAGDCGSPLLVCNDQFARKLVGFHIAGEPGFGCSSIVTLNDVAALLRNENTSAEPKLVSPQDNEQFPLVGAFEYIGIANPPANQPLKTQLQPSLIQGMIGPVETLPSAKAPILTPNGPMLKAIHKYARPSPLLDETIVAHAVKDYEDLINTYPALEIEQRVLSDEEAVEGIHGNEFFPPVKRMKSAGWPHSYLVKGKGKLPWLGEAGGEKPPLYHELMREMHEMEEQCRKGIVPETYFVDTLKDEKRPIEKVEAGKTRVFSASSLPFTLLCRKYFAGFLAFMMRTKIGNECAVGVNAIGKDWERIVHALKRFGDKSLIAADFANFDGTINYYLFVRIVEIINRFYNDGAQNARVRKMIWECICKSAHIMGPFAYRLTHGQPSGNPTTAITNSVYNSLSVRYCFFYRFLIELGKKAPSFRKVIRMLAYGDDQLISVSQTIQQDFTPQILSRLYAMIGMEYTSETKKDQTDEFRDFNEVTFLKRAFSYDPVLHHWFAPLDIRSIRESCNWVRKSTSVEDATLENVQDALVELYHHSERTFEEYSEKFKTAVSRVSEYRVTHYDWDFARRLIAADRGSELYSTERAWV